jgi:hypothetical protein
VFPAEHFKPDAPQGDPNILQNHQVAPSQIFHFLDAAVIAHQQDILRGERAVDSGQQKGAFQSLTLEGKEIRDGHTQQVSLFKLQGLEDGVGPVQQQRTVTRDDSIFIRDKPGINLHGGAGVVLVDTGEERLGKGVSHNGGISRLAQILRDPGTRAGGKQEQCRQHEPKAADADRQPEVEQ